jgi:Dolichyl-phosphate-mannose-protein mannosyltransferase
MDYYALVSDKLLRGGILYRNAIDTKPPLVFFHYALIFRLFGKDNVTAVKIVTMVWLGLSAVATRNIFRELFPSSSTPERAALLFVLASFSGWGEDFLSSNTEILSNLFVLLGAWCMVKDGFSDSGRRLTVGGMLVGIACLYRYQAGAILAAYFFTVVLLRAHFSRIIHRFFYLGIGFLIPIGALVAYYAWIAGLPDLAFLLRYQSYYLRQHNLYLPQVLGQIGIVVVSQAPFLLLAVWQAVRMARQPVLTRRDVFLLLFLGFSVMPFFLGGHYYPHYMVQAIPPVVLLATEALSHAAVAPSGGFRLFFFRHRWTFIVVNVSLFTLVNTAYYSLVVRSDGPSPALAGFIQQHTNPDDSVFLWTWRPNVLFEADRVYATRFLSNEFLTGRLYVTAHRLPTATAESARVAMIPELWPMLLQDLRTEKPRVIVDEAPGGSNFTLDRYPALSEFVGEYYEPGQVMDGLCVYLRKTG